MGVTKADSIFDKYLVKKEVIPHFPRVVVFKVFGMFGKPFLEFHGVPPIFLES
jgi:hypothetical protein